MDGSLWTGIIILLIVTGAIILLAMNGGKAHRKKMQKRISDFAARTGGNISESEAWRHRAIGIDRNKHRLYFINIYHDAEEEVEIDLKDIKTCAVTKASASGRETDAGQNKRIEMELVSARSGAVVGIIPFFDILLDKESEREPAEQMAKRWSELVGSYVNPNK